MYNVKVQNTLRLVMLRLAIENNDPNKKKISMNKCFVLVALTLSFLQKSQLISVCHLSLGMMCFV